MKEEVSLQSQLGTEEEEEEEEEEGEKQEEIHTVNWSIILII